MADAQDLKSCGSNPVPVRFRSPAPVFLLDAGNQKLNIAGWSSPVARWAHNPKVVGSNPAPATKLMRIVEFYKFDNPCFGC